MNNRIIKGIVLLVSGIVIGFLIQPNNTGITQDKQYPYLNSFYNRPYTPTFAEWGALNLTAQHNTSEYLTAKLIQNSFQIYLKKELIQILVDTRTQPRWNTYLDGGRFNVTDREVRQAYSETSENVIKVIRTWFPEESGLDNSHIEILFSIQGSVVGTWFNGEFKLAGE